MYVLEYLIYHIKVYGVDSRKDFKISDAYRSAIKNMGTDDVFKKNETDFSKLLGFQNWYAHN